MFTVMAIKILPRNVAATKVQEILTKYGCIIQTRLGLHEADKNTCSSSGLILLNLLHDEQEEIKKLKSELDSIEGVTSKIIEI
ncbi:MAG: hypothetical protein ACRC68_00260 [Clostridium sp.]